MSSRNLNMARAGRCGFVAAQPGCAAAALAMACSTSECLASATFAWASPVLGSKTSPNRPEPPFTVLPPMKWPISRMGRTPPLLFMARNGDYWSFGAGFVAIFEVFQRRAAGGGAFRAVFFFERVGFFPPLHRPSWGVSGRVFSRDADAVGGEERVVGADL